MKKILFLFTLLMPMLASAQTRINGIYYNLYSGTQQATVTSGSTKYSGKVTIPQTVTYNGVTYSVTEIKSAAFSKCSDLSSVTIPNSVTSIGKQAFYECTYLTAVNIPNGVTSIGEGTFSGCTYLTSVTIPNSVTSIGDNAFYACKDLTSIKIPNSVKTIGRLAFQYCYSLISVTIPNSVTSIGENAFYSCNQLKSVTIPYSVTTIEEGVFAYTGLTSVTIPNSVTSIGRVAFSGCKGLTEVTIPNNVTSIGEEAFRGCEALKEVTIPNSVTEIGKSAFIYCHDLKSVTIGNSVTEIGVSAFSSCENLTNFYCYADNPPSANSAFNTSHIANATLYVTKASVDAYKATAPWNEFGNIVAINIPIDVNSTNFPDENFRNWISSQYFGKDGVLTDTEIANVTEIDVSGTPSSPGAISSLKGIEFFTKLTRLICSYNQLTSLDVSKNTALTYLGCSANQLTTLDVSKNTVLTKLYCFANQFTSLDVSGCTALTELGCSSNQLTSLDVSKNTALTWLSCGSNQLTSLDVSKNTALTYLSFSYNQLTSLDVSKNTMLTSLHCENNQLTSLDVSKNTALTTLYCYSNQINRAAMEALVNSLPTVSSGKIYVIYNENEGNVMTTTQVATAKAKGWTPQYYDGSKWQEYAGSEPEPEPTPEPLKICATPTITFVDGELQFDCETEGVEYSYIITGPAVIGNGNKISLPTTYHVSVHAEKEGYIPSMTAMKEINVSGTGGIRGDVNLDGTVGMPDAMFIVNYVLNGKFPDEEEPMTYYYYAGWTLPTESNIETIINETLPENSGSSTLNNCGKKTTSKSSMDFSSNALYNVNGRDYYYVLVPEGQTIVDTENVDITENYTSQGTITIGNQSHVIYKSNMTTRYINDITIY